MPEQVTLVDELASALNALLEGRVDYRADAIAAMQRYELERDRTDLDAATLPVRVVVILEDGLITSALTDFPNSCELTVIDYSDAKGPGWEPVSFTQIPQIGGGFEPAHAYNITPREMPGRVAELCRAVFVADCASPSTH